MLFMANILKTGMTPISVNDLEKKMSDNKFDGKIQGKVVEVCQAMGCWAKIKKEDGSYNNDKSKGP